MQINFSRKDISSEPSGFDMGDISIEFGNERISSQDSPRNLMMIYIAIADLIFGVLELKDRNGSYEFVGADSSFIVNFKTKGRFLEISQKNGVKFVCNWSEFLGSLCSSVKEFLASGNNLKSSDSANLDLQLAIEKLKKAKPGV